MWASTERALHFRTQPESMVIKMADRRTAERLTAERLIVPGESLERIPMQDEPEEQTQPLRLSFLALLAERDPVVQARLNQRRRLALATLPDELPDDDNRPTDPMLELDEPA
jgi:hypothetical protein